MKWIYAIEKERILFLWGVKYMGGNKSSVSTKLIKTSPSATKGLLPHLLLSLRALVWTTFNTCVQVFQHSSRFQQEPYGMHIHQSRNMWKTKEENKHLQFIIAKYCGAFWKATSTTRKDTTLLWALQTLKGKCKFSKLNIYFPPSEPLFHFNF